MSDEMVQDILEEQRKKNMENRKGHQNGQWTASFDQSASNADASTRDPQSMLATGSQSLWHPATTASKEPLEMAETNETIRLSAQDISHRDAENADVERAI